MDYDQVPTTVFTPIEYGCCGLAEEDAIAKFGEENIEIFHSYFQPLEWTVPHKQENACYMKMVTVAELVEAQHVSSVAHPQSFEVTCPLLLGRFAIR